MPKCDSIFISYSHKDQKWLERLNLFLKPLLRSSSFVVWDDTKIIPGQQWQDEITAALESSKVAVLLVSPNYIASDFIHEEELPAILNKATTSGLQIFWILIRPCLYEETALNVYQAANDLEEPLASLSEHKVDEVLKSICQRIKEVYDNESTLLKSNTNEETETSSIPEIAPDDWSKTGGSLFNRLKNLIR